MSTLSGHCQSCLCRGHDKCRPRAAGTASPCYFLEAGTAMPAVTLAITVSPATYMSGVWGYVAPCAQFPLNPDLGADPPEAGTLSGAPAAIPGWLGTVSASLTPQMDSKATIRRTPAGDTMTPAGTATPESTAAEQPKGDWSTMADSGPFILLTSACPRF